MDTFLSNFNAELESEKRKTKQIGVPSSSWDGKEISLGDYQKFSELFKSADLSKEGKVSAELGMKLLSKSKLDAAKLSTIWHLADSDKDNKLNQNEFVVAMYLVQEILGGEVLPTVIPRNLFVPPTLGGVKKVGENKSVRDSGLLKRDNDGAVTIIRLGKNTDGRPAFKVCILGEQCGKTMLVHRFLFDEFSEDHEATVEDLYEANYDFDDHRNHLLLLDTSGSEFYADSLQEQWFTSTDGFLLVFSVESRNSFKSLETYRAQIMKHLKDDRIPIVVVGTKSDLSNRKVTPSEGKLWAYRYGFSYIECSAKSGANIELPFQQIIIKIEKNLAKGLSIQVQPHRWKKTHFPTPTTCRICNKLIWGVLFSYGFQCEICKLPCHKQCMDRSPKQCKPVTRGSSHTSTMQPMKTAAIDDVVNYVTNEELALTLQDEASSKEFVEFLETKLNAGAKHVRFWQDVEEYKRIMKDFPLERKAKAEKIYAEYVISNEKTDFKLPDKFLEEIKEDYSTEKFDADLFTNSQIYIYNQIEREFFPAFIKKMLYRTYRGLDDPQPQNKQSVQEIFNLTEMKTALPVEEEVAKKEEKPVVSVDEIKEWFFGTTNRVDTEKMLLATRVNSFLIRNSSLEGRYALSIYSEKNRSFVHWIIAPTVFNEYAIQDCPADPMGTYPSLSELVKTCPLLKDHQPLGRLNPSIKLKEIPSDIK